MIEVIYSSVFLSCFLHWQLCLHLNKPRSQQRASAVYLHNCFSSCYCTLESHIKCVREKYIIANNHTGGQVYRQTAALPSHSWTESAVYYWLEDRKVAVSASLTVKSPLPPLASVSADRLDGDIWQCTRRTVNHSSTVTVMSKHRPRPIKKRL